MLKIFFNENELHANSAIAVLVSDQLSLDNNGMELDQKFHGIISKTINDKKKFKGDFGSQVLLNTSDKEGNLKTIIVISVGDEGKLKEFQLEEIGGKIFNLARAAKADSVGLKVNDRIGSFAEDKAAALIASGAKLAAYSFDKYFTKKDKESEIELNLSVKDIAAVEKCFTEYSVIADSVHFARDLVSEVPNVLYPAHYAEQVATKLGELGG